MNEVKSLRAEQVRLRSPLNDFVCALRFIHWWCELRVAACWCQILNILSIFLSTIWNQGWILKIWRCSSNINDVIESSVLVICGVPWSYSILSVSLIMAFLPCDQCWDSARISPVVAARAECLMRSDLRGSGMSLLKARWASTSVNTEKSLLKYCPREKAQLPLKWSQPICSLWKDHGDQVKQARWHEGEPSPHRTQLEMRSCDQARWAARAPGIDLWSWQD